MNGKHDIYMHLSRDWFNRFYNVDENSVGEFSVFNGRSLVAGVGKEIFCSS